MSVDLITQQVKRMRHTVICDLPVYNTCFHITS